MYAMYNIHPLTVLNCIDIWLTFGATKLKNANRDLTTVNLGLYVIMFYEEGKFMFSQKWVKA